MTNRNILLAPLQPLGDMFAKHGYSLYFVGGVVRDFLVGKHPKDIDFATSATPDEQIEMYETEGLSWIPTGLDHGTITVKFGTEFYEITTFRVDQETDGRHAVVEYTRDITTDLSRRDLTINSMAMDFNGTIIDPFGGQNDLQDGVINFVGNPSERISEDYLRILRFFRFYGRYGKIANRESLLAISEQITGLREISVERIWVELSKIMSHTLTGGHVIDLMKQIGVDHAIGVTLDRDDYEKGAQVTRDPAMLLGFMHYSRGTTGETYMRVTDFKLSRDELARMRFASESIGGYTRARAESDLLSRVPRERVITALYYHGLDDDARELAEWEIPIFPVTGDDLLAIGFEQGRAVGLALEKMKKAWVGSNYQMTAKQLISGV